MVCLQLWIGDMLSVTLNAVVVAAGVVAVLVAQLIAEERDK